MNDRRDASACCRARDFRRCGLALPERLLKTFESHVLPDRPPMPEAIGNGLRDTEDLHRHAFDRYRFNIFFEQVFREANDAQWHFVNRWRPVVLSDGKPDRSGKLVRNLVKRQSRGETDHALRDAFRRLRKAVIHVQRRVWQLIQAAREAHHFTIRAQPADGRRRAARRLEVGQAGDAPIPEHRQGAHALRLASRH